jgi:hypothetical protein
MGRTWVAIGSPLHPCATPAGPLAPQPASSAAAQTSQANLRISQECNPPGPPADDSRAAHRRSVGNRLTLVLLTEGSGRCRIDRWLSGKWARFAFRCDGGRSGSKIDVFPVAIPILDEKSPIGSVLFGGALMHLISEGFSRQPHRVAKATMSAASQTRAVTFGPNSHQSSGICAGCLLLSPEQQVI